MVKMVDVLEDLKTMNVRCYAEVATDRRPVSYTHLDVYKRQLLGWAAEQ